MLKKSWSFNLDSGETFSSWCSKLKYSVRDSTAKLIKKEKTKIWKIMLVLFVLGGAP